MHEPAVLADEVGLAARPEARLLEHDSIQAVEVEVRREHGDALSPASEQGRRDRDHGRRREVGRRDRLDVGVRAPVEEVVLVPLRQALVLLDRRHDDRPVGVEHEELLGVGGLRDHVAEHRVDVGPCLGRLGAVERALEQRLHVAVQRGHALARFVSAQQTCHEDDVATLLVDPAVEGAGLQLRGSLEPVEDRRLERAPRPQVRHDPHDRDHRDRQHEERDDELGHQAPSARDRSSGRSAHDTSCAIVAMSNAPASVA